METFILFHIYFASLQMCGRSDWLTSALGDAAVTCIRVLLIYYCFTGSNKPSCIPVKTQTSVGQIAAWVRRIGLGLFCDWWRDGLSVCMHCVAVCPVGFYGRNCNVECSSHCHLNSSTTTTATVARCFRSGTCVAGCQTGWIGERCNTGILE